MKIVDVLEVDSKKYACIQGDDLIPGMLISKISTPYGIIAVKGSPVKEACFSPGKMQGVLLLDNVTEIAPCVAEILEYSLEY